MTEKVESSSAAEKLQDQLRAERHKSSNLEAEVQRLEGVAERNWKFFLDTHSALNVLREDANRVLADHDATALYAELKDTRERYESLRARRSRWMQFARQAVEMKTLMAQKARDLEDVVRQLNERIALVEEQRDDVTRTAQEVTGELEAKLDRIGEQCRLWHRGELDTMTTIAGITGEMNGHPLPQPGVWDRAKAVRAAEVLSRLQQAEDELQQVDNALADAGIDHPNGARGVRDLKVQRDAAQDVLDDWKTAEAQARGAVIRVLKVYGHGEGSLAMLAQFGKYDDLIEALESKSD